LGALKKLNTLPKDEEQKATPTKKNKTRLEPTNSTRRFHMYNQARHKKDRRPDRANGRANSQKAAISTLSGTIKAK
jgi:hypothetical protein